MSDCGSVFVIGMAIGRKQKPWSELTARERKIRIGLIVVLSIILLLGVITFFLAKN